MNKKKFVWAFISIIIAALSIWAVTAQNKDFSVEMFRDFVESADKKWFIASLICTFGYIWFEGRAIIVILKALGYKKNPLKGTVYGAADVYFSAVTPSASGGQPASAYFMMKDGISGTAVTVTLLINLVLYTVALVVLGCLSLIFRFDIFVDFSVFSRILIICGFALMAVLSVLFYMLLCKSSILYKISKGMISFLHKIHVIKHDEKYYAKLDRVIEEYQQCVQMLKGKSKVIIKAFIYNILQRMSQLGASFLVFMSLGEGLKKSFDIFVTQCFVALGSNCVPIPGAMGVADYLMLDGFSNVVGEEASTNMELLCRGVTFYGCIIAGALIVIISYILRKMKDRRC